MAKRRRLRVVAGAFMAGLTVTATAMLPGVGWSPAADSVAFAAPVPPSAPDVRDPSAADPTSAVMSAPGAAASSLPRSWDRAKEAELFRSAEESAYAYLKQHRFAETGLVSATEFYENATTWDIASLILGVHAGGELGLASKAETEAWLKQILETLGRVQLFDGAGYNKVYSTRTGQMIGVDNNPSTLGRGWSAIDLGRLLISFKVVEQNHPSLAQLARAAANRLDFDRIVKDGYIQGAEPRSKRIVTYSEGRLGYEQYAAMGYALWGHEAKNALDLRKNTKAVEVMGETMLRDKRGSDRLTSEPIVLMGLELGWSPDFKNLASAMLRAQEKRYKETGQITIASEDALQTPPHYFYYYTFWSDGKPFTVRAMGAVGEAPRWVSAKAAYGWHALMPNDYTWSAVNAVDAARSPSGWSSGIYEGNGRSTEVRNLNTAGVILQAALYREQGHALLASR